jgi:hypothetical protein
VVPENDERIKSFLAWRRRRALEAGLFRPEQLLDEWVFRRMLLHEPKDIYDLEDLRLLTAPLFHQYGEDLLRLCRGTPTEDERPRNAKRSAFDDEDREPVRARRPDRPHRTETIRVRAGVSADAPTVTLRSDPSRSDRRMISDFHPADQHEEWRGRAFEFRCSSAPFKYWETEFLEIWGALLDAIADGTEQAVSPDEQALLELASRSRKAGKEWEQAWTKLVLRRSFESN